MQIELNLKQLSYLKGLNSKKKQRKFLLDCLVENAIGESEKIDHKILMQKMEESKGQIRKLKEANLSPKQIEAVLEWLSGYEQLKGSVIPIRFKEDAAAEQEIFNKFPNPHDFKAVSFSTHEKVDLSKELYLTFDCSDGRRSSAIRVLDFEKGIGFGFRQDGVYHEDGWSFKTEKYWRKSTPEEIKSMLIKKLEADGLKVGCLIDQIALGPNYTISKFNTTLKWIWEYTEYDDTLCLNGWILYRNGQFATIIPQEEPKNEIPELVNSSDYIKEILVVDFENVSQKIE